MDSLFISALDLFLTMTGKVLVPVLSLGFWRADALLKQEGHIHGAAGSLSFRRNGKRVITHTGQLFLGLAFYVAVAFLLVAYAGQL